MKKIVFISLASIGILAFSILVGIGLILEFYEKVTDALTSLTS